MSYYYATTLCRICEVSENFYWKSIQEQRSYHIATTQSIQIAKQLIGFYVMRTLDITHFMALVSFYITRKYQKTNHGGVLVTLSKVFSGDIEREKCH